MKIDFTQKIVLLDFDGTIVATEHLAKESILQYFEDKSLFLPGQVSEVFSKMIVGRTWAAAIENMIQYAKTLNISLDSPEILAHEFKRRYREKFEEGAKLIPGFLDVLPKIRAQARYIGIVTGSEHVEVNAILQAKGLQGAFDRIWAYGDYSKSKPDPAPYLQAMKDLGAHPSEVWVFEDSQAGMDSAHEAGLPWVQICFEEHAQKPDARSKWVIRDWTELL